MISVDILAVVLNERTGRIEVVKEITNDDGSIEYAGQDFHPETLEWWAAVYDIHDIDELVELLVLEPHLENINPMELSKSAARNLQRQKVTDFKTKHQKVVKTKGTAKVMLSKSPLDKRYVEAATDAPLEVIKHLCHFDLEVVELKKQHIERIRKATLNKPSVVEPTRKQRMERLTRQLDLVGEASRARSKAEKTSKALPTIELGKRGKRVR